MGRITGFFSGLTLSTMGLYLFLRTHQSNRTAQAQALRQQRLVLAALVEPELVPVDDAPRFRARRVSWTETWKDRWNAEVEGLVRGAQATDWDAVRAAVEGRVRGVWEGKGEGK